MAGTTKYTNAIATQICEGLADGLSLRQICNQKGYPSRTTVNRWLAANTAFCDQYARAREAQTEFYTSEMVDISDEMPTHEVPDPDGGVSVRIDPAGIQRNKLRIDTRKWIASKLLPKKYGEKVGVEHSGTVTLEGLISGDVGE